MNFAALAPAFPIAVALSLAGASKSSAAFPGVSGDKTLVAWVVPSSLEQRGGSVLTLDDRHSHFDGIVFGELEPARWMAGSDFYHRTSRDQETVPRETADAHTAVQVAIVYQGMDVTVYRNGIPYAHHTISAPQAFGPGSAVVIGPRHLESQDGAGFSGAIDDARIYGTALSREQIAALRPNVLSDPKPIAWWNFENGKAEDVLGAFPEGTLLGGARVESGHLVLVGEESAFVTPAAAALVADAPPAPDVPDEWVLNYHLMHPGAESMPGDPNAAFYLDGVYHLHYILRHPWKGRQSFAFIHVTSPDMLHWTWQPTKLQRSFTGHGMFSGTGFETKEGRPAAIYHGESSGRNQIALAKDRLLTDWEKPFPVEVRMADGSAATMNHWDPDCFLIGDTYYAISGGGNPPVFKSQDLRHWTYIGDFLRNQMPDVTVGEDISCPNFFPLGDQWMLLCISHPMGCRYYLGDWDAKVEQFVPKRHGRMNWARSDQPAWGLFQRTDFFAPETVRTPDGRRVMWAWLTSVGSGNPLLNRTVQSLPRELSLPADGVLRMRPFRELEGQRSDPVLQNDVKLTAPVTGLGDGVPPASAPALQRIAELPGESVEIRITVDREQAVRKMFGVVLFSDGKGGGLPVMVRPETGTLRVGTAEAPFAVADLPAGQPVELRIFIDRYLVEVFSNDRQALVAAEVGPRNGRGLDAFCVGAPTTFRSVELWTIRPTNQGFLEARKNHVWEPKSR